MKFNKCKLLAPVPLPGRLMLVSQDMALFFILTAGLLPFELLNLPLCFQYYNNGYQEQHTGNDRQYAHDQAK